MPDTDVIEQPAVATEVAPTRKDPFADDSWTETRPQKQADVPRGTVKESVVVQPDATKNEENKPFDVKAFVKETYGWDDPDIGKSELAELRELRNKPLKFDNEESERIYNHIKSGNKAEIKKYLDREERLSSLDALKPDEIIKMHIQEANPHYTPEDIQDVFEDKYSLPEKPDSGGDETDPVYLANLDKWQKQVDKINRSIGRDSFSAKEALAKLKTELVLPDIQKGDSDAAARAQGIAQQQAAMRSSYEEAFNKDFGAFNGFNVEAISGEAKLPISYGISPEEDTALKSKMFDFDLTDYFDKRWFKDGKPNIPLMKQDLYELENRDKIHQKIANEAASKAVDNHLKIRGNIQVEQPGSNPGDAFTADAKDAARQKAIQKMWDEA
jgi:hypothetical protein